MRVASASTVALSVLVLLAFGGNPCGVLMGALGQGFDSAAEPMSWGGIKSLYR